MNEEAMARVGPQRHSGKKLSLYFIIKVMADIKKMSHLSRKIPRTNRIRVDVPRFYNTFHGNIPKHMNHQLPKKENLDLKFL
jgi:hypothetical protein